MTQHFSAPVFRSDRHRSSTGKKGRSFRRSRLEALEARRVLASPTLGALPAEVSILAGAPLHIALDGFDSDGDSLTYSTSSTDPLLSAIITKQEPGAGNRSLRITVSHRLGTDTPSDPSDDQVVQLGTMEFELFEGRASRATSRIIDLAQAGWYDGKLFHRVISDFMIQGGSRNGNGVLGRDGDPPFDDQFDPTLQHTSEGLLSMAKGGDDSNNSQFFITDTDTRWLDFNHTIFGFLTSGDDVRQAITAVPVPAGGSRPLNDVVIESVEVFYDREDAVMMLAAPEGSSGDAEVTVTVSDGNGGTAQRTIRVLVEPDTANGSPYLKDIDPIWLDFDTPRTFSLNAVDVEGDQVFFSGKASPATGDLDVVVSSDGQVIITPKNDQFGAYTVMFEAGSASYNMQDSQVVPVFIRPPAPTIALAPLSDTGVPDGVTAVNNGAHSLEFVVSGVAFGATAWMESGGAPLATNEVSRTPANDGSGTYDVLLALTAGQLADGVYEYRAGQTVALANENAGTNLTSDLSGLLSVTVDTIAPVIGSAPVLSVDSGTEYRYQVQATDGNNNDLRYEVQTPYPGMQQDPVTGVITWTPGVDQAGIRPLVVFAIDGAGNTGRQEFDILVNASLQISIQGNTEAAEGSTLSFLVQASDVDDPAAILDLSLHDTTLPGGATYSLTPGADNTATFEWVVTEEDGPGEYQVTFRATDGTGTVKDETYTITASEINVPPELTVAHQGWTPGDLLSIAENEAFLLDVGATDSDLPANDLVFSLAGDVPDGAAIDPDSGEFTWTPSEQQGGLELDMIVRVTDSGGLSDQVTVNVAVTEVNSPPVFDPVDPLTTFEGLDIEVDLTARDPDVPTNEIRYSLVEGEFPEGAAVDAQTGKLTWEVPSGFLENHDPNQPVKITVKAEEVVPAGEEPLSALTTVEVTVADNIVGLLAGIALLDSGPSDPFFPVSDVSFDLPMFGGTPPGQSIGTPSAETSNVGGRGANLFDPLFGTRGSGSGERKRANEAENESEKENRPDDNKDPGKTKTDSSQEANIVVPLDVVSSDHSDAAIEEYLDDEASTGVSPRQSDQPSGTSNDDGQVAVEDEERGVYTEKLEGLEELIAAVAKNESTGS